MPRLGEVRSEDQDRPYPQVARADSDCALPKPGGEETLSVEQGRTRIVCIGISKG